MDPYVFFRYQQYVDITGKVEYSCPDEHGQLHAFVTQDGVPYFECLGCDYKLHPGLKMYEHMKSIVKEIDG